MPLSLPRTLTLPSGERITVAEREAGDPPSRRPEGTAGAALFADVLAMFDDRRLNLSRGQRSIDVRALPLADFHVVRAVLIKAELLAEDEVELDCHNCAAPLLARPCAGLEIGPWEDGEADDEELDRTVAFGTPWAIAPIAVGRVRHARTMTLSPRRVADALPLFSALGRDPFVIDAAVVEAMGIEALGAIRDPARIARLLADCAETTFASVTDLFLAAHYPLRLACDVFCPTCKARNTISAPALREFAASEDALEERPSDPEAPVPELDTFVEQAHRIADPLLATIPGPKVEVVVDVDVPAVDDGGEPLLGSYVPPPPADALVPQTPATVTIYYRTFQAIEREDGRYDWEGELKETIEHELEHHLYFLRGEDPMDDAEHAAIEQEAVRVVGRGEATRRTLALFGLSVPDFVRRAWPLFVIAALALAISLAEGRCGG